MLAENLSLPLDWREPSPGRKRLYSLSEELAAFSASLAKAQSVNNEHRAGRWKDGYRACVCQ